MSLISSQKVHINYLNKEELKYELLYRGIQINPCSAVETLRKSLRDHFNAVTNSANLNAKYKVSEELSGIEIRVDQMNNLLEDHDESSVLEFSKLKAKLAHANLRLFNLSQATTLDPSQQTLLQKYNAKLSEINDRLTKLNTLSEETVENFNETLNKSMEDEEAFLEKLTNPVKTTEMQSNLAEPSTSKELNMPKSNPIAYSNNNEQTITSQLPNDSVSTPILNNPSLLANQTTNPNLQNTEIFQSSLPRTQENQTSNPSLQLNANPKGYHQNYSLFNKLPNPLEKLLGQINPCNGLDIGGLLQFLRTLTELRTQANLSDCELYEILPVYSLPPLQSKLVDCKRLNLSWNATHQEIINSFIPVSLYETLKNDLILRPQRHEEPLSLYISEVKISSLMLKCSYSEGELVHLIKNGMTPEVRNRLSFESNPSTFQDLEKLTISANNKRYLDYLRDQQVNFQPNYMPNNLSMYNNQSTHPNLRLNNPNVHNHYTSTRTPPHFTPRNYVPRNAPNLCFKCKKPGHIAKNCYSKPNQPPRNNLN